jgi:hypothetical protein
MTNPTEAQMREAREILERHGIRYIPAISVVAQALANARADGRKAGIEEAADRVGLRALGRGGHSLFDLRALEDEIRALAEGGK